MPRVGRWRSAWAWLCPQRRVKRSRLDGGRHPAVHIGEKGGDGVGVPGVIAGGVHMAAGAAGGNGAHGGAQTCSIRMPRHPRNRARSAVGLHPVRSLQSQSIGSTMWADNFLTLEALRTSTRYTRKRIVEGLPIINSTTAQSFTATATGVVLSVALPWLATPANAARPPRPRHSQNRTPRGARTHRLRRERAVFSL